MAAGFSSFEPINHCVYNPKKSLVVWDADKKPSPLVQRLVLDDGDPIHHVVWLSEKQFASFSKDQNDGIIHICQIGKETPTMTFVHGVRN